MACFQGDGKSPPVSDILSMRVMNGATVDAHSLRSHVGRGSEAHCFQGDILMARMTSSPLTVVKIARSGVASCSIWRSMNKLFYVAKYNKLFYMAKYEQAVLYGEV